MINKDRVNEVRRKVEDIQREAREKCSHLIMGLQEDASKAEMDILMGDYKTSELPANKLAAMKLLEVAKIQLIEQEKRLYDHGRFNNDFWCIEQIFQQVDHQLAKDEVKAEDQN